MKINPDLARIKTDLSGNETDYSASIKAVKSLQDSTNSSIDTLTQKSTDTDNILKRLASIYPGFGQIPLHTTVANIDKNVFGIYTVLNDSGAPISSNSNDWFTIVNIPAQQGTSYSIQIAFSYWDLNSSSHGVWIKHGRDTTWLRLTFTS